MSGKIRLRLILLFAPCLVAGLACADPVAIRETAQQSPQQNSTGTKLRELVRALIEAINGGDQKLISDFVQANFSQASTKTIPAYEYVKALQKLHEQSGGFEVLSEIPSSEPQTARLQVRSKRGNKVGVLATRWDPAQPDKLDAYRFNVLPEPSAVNWGAKVAPNAVLNVIEKGVSEAASQDKFSGVVLVAKGDKIVLHKAYGFRDQKTKTPNKLDTKFNLGSMGKMFTSVAIAQLVQAGKLSYEDKLSKVLPEFPNKEAADKITISQILTHTAGLGNIFTPEFSENKKKFQNPSDYLRVFGPKPLLFEPGTSWQYSNFGFVVLGAIVERLSGESYFEYVKAHVFKPAGMTNTATYSVEEHVENLAEGYTRVGTETSDPMSLEPRKTNRETLPWKGTPAGGGYSTARDLLKLARALRSYRLINRELTEKITSGHVKAPIGMYGFGFQVDPERNFRGHAGGAQGINSELKILWDKDYTVVVMGNYDPPAAQILTTQIATFLSNQAG